MVHPKLEVKRRLMDCGCKVCVEIDCKRQRMLMKLRGMAELRIETVRWCGLRRDKWIPKMYDKGEAEVVEQFYCTVKAWQRRERRWRG